MQKFRPLQGPNLGPLEPILLFGLHAEATPSVWDMCFRGYRSHLAFSLTEGHQLSIHKHLSFQFLIDSLF